MTGGRAGDSRIAPTGRGEVGGKKCEWVSPRFLGGPRNDRVRVGPRIDTGARKSERGRVGSESEFSRHAFAMPMGQSNRSGV